MLTLLLLLTACTPVDTFTRPCPVPTVGPGRPRSVIVEPPTDVEVTAWQCDDAGIVCIQADAWTENGRWWAACDLDAVDSYPTLVTEWPSL
jgi:hypothetical protein